MRITRDDPEWSRLKAVWFQETVDVLEIAVAVDDEEGWVEVQCPPEPEVERMVGTVRIELKQFPRSRSESVRGSE